MRSAEFRQPLGMADGLGHRACFVMLAVFDGMVGKPARS